MGFIHWLQELGRDADPAAPGFQPQLVYIAVCVSMPVLVGLAVGFGVRLLERLLGIQLGKGGH